MKKIIITILVFVFIITSATPCNAKKHTRTHVRYADGIIYCYDATEHLCYIQTSDGNLWTCKVDCTQLGRVRVKFDTMKTRKVEDDRIVKISFIK